MDQHLNPRFRHREKPCGFDQFQPLVEHGGGINADLGTHGPDRVAHRDFRRDSRHFRQRHGATWPARSSQDDLRHRRRVAHIKCLENGVMFAIHGQDGRTPSAGCGQNGLARANQAFLIGNRHHAAAGECRHGGGQAGRAHNGGHGPIGGQAGRRDHCL